MPARPAVDPHQFEALAREGATNAELMAAFECSQATVVRWRRRLGVAGRAQPAYSPEDLALIRACLDDGWSFAEIHRTHGYDTEAIRKYFPGRAWTRQQIIEHSTLTQLDGKQRRRLRRKAA